jgi:hypothetical protein
MKDKIMAAPDQESSHITTPYNVANLIKLNCNGKLNSILRKFAGGNTYNRFSNQNLDDHCMPITVRELQKQYGLTFNERLLKVPNGFGGTTHISFYWLEGDCLKKAQVLSDIGVS